MSKIPLILKPKLPTGNRGNLLNLNIILKPRTQRAVLKIAVLEPSGAGEMCMAAYGACGLD